ncbi:hypothetical protein [Streptomyces sp. SM12]|uniref:hypothetical protein n=1 Tax=Streptomyces sp. SM12 TaxID=1071602 RepID=UPI0011B0F377|nr:hypothetical protein [Streptomyces sp. SM12]
MPGHGLVLAKEEQWVGTTASRHCQPRAWMRAVEWAVGAELHPKTNLTTVRIARDIRRRMGFDTGHGIYDLDGISRRLGVHRATVKRHVAHMRQLGLLVWVREGSRRNLRLEGSAYTATAAIYAGTIPAAYDDAHGLRTAGGGYEARVVGYTEAGRERAIRAAGEDARRRGATSRVKATKKTAKGARRTRSADSTPPRRAPHSHPASLEVQVQMVGGCKDTQSASNKTPSTSKNPTPKRSSCGGSGRSARQVQADVQIARQVRPRIRWAQREGLRRLAFALRPFIDRGLTADGIVTELAVWTTRFEGIGLAWVPRRPAAFITKQLRSTPGLLPEPALGAVAMGPAPAALVEDPEVVAKRARRRRGLRLETMRLLAARGADLPGGVDGFEPEHLDVPQLVARPSGIDRADARARFRSDPHVLADYVDAHGIDAALDLFGPGLIAHYGERFPGRLPGAVIWGGDAEEAPLFSSGTTEALAETPSVPERPAVRPEVMGDTGVDCCPGTDSEGCGALLTSMNDLCDACVAFASDQPEETVEGVLGDTVAFMRAAVAAVAGVLVLGPALERSVDAVAARLRAEHTRAVVDGRHALAAARELADALREEQLEAVRREVPGVRTPRSAADHVDRVADALADPAAADELCAVEGPCALRPFADGNPGAGFCFRHQPVRDDEGQDQARTAVAVTEEDLCADGCGRPALLVSPRCRRCHQAATTDALSSR